MWCCGEYNRRYLLLIIPKLIVGSVLRERLALTGSAKWASSPPPTGQTQCLGICVDKTTDPLNCGGCGNAVRPGFCIRLIYLHADNAISALLVRSAQIAHVDVQMI
jgi:hypothetical protein